MPGKVNPVIPEMVVQVSMKVMGLDATIAFAAASGNLELNAFLPLIADCLLEELRLLIGAVTIFREKCILLLQPDADRCEALLESSSVFVTALTPYIGYDKAVELRKSCENDREKLKGRILEEGLLDVEILNKILL